MKVRIIGGHGGVSPGFKATSYLIDEKLLIDAGSCACGVHIEEQMLIDHILISHAHLDHIKDLAFISDNCFGLRPRPFEVYSTPLVRSAIKTHLMNDIIWPDFTKIPSEDKPTIRFNIFEVEKTFELEGYKILPIRVNHPTDGVGFIIEKNDVSVLFTQDTGPTDRIWEVAHTFKNLKAIFTEVSFPNRLKSVATVSQHHTPKSMQEEIKKMPEKPPIFLGHLKPNYQVELFKEIKALNNDRISILSSDDTSYIFK